MFLMHIKLLIMWFNKIFYFQKILDFSIFSMKVGGNLLKK